MSKLLCIDTNILARFFCADHPDLSPKAKEIFSKAQEGKIKIYLDEIIVAETVWLLSSYYKFKKESIVLQLQELVSQPWIINSRKKLILEVLELYSKLDFHYVDCWIYCMSKSVSGELKTFDKRLEKLAGRN